MAIACPRPLPGGFWYDDVSSSGHACKTEKTTKCSLQVKQKSYYSSVQLKNRIRTPFNRTYSSTVLSDTLPLKKVQRISGERSRKSHLTITILSLHSTSKENHSQSEKKFVLDVGSEIVKQNDFSQGESTDPEVLDQWLRDAVFEIVQHLHEAPFIQLILDSKNKHEKPDISGGLYMKPDLWTFIRSSVLQSSALGLILVQKLDMQWLSQLCLAEKHSTEISLPSEWIKADESSSNTDIWGILVEGKGIVWPNCYILKTTRVASCAGICTHFCMVKAKCFGPSLQDQLEKMWLL